jgi:hypothetical protein
MHFNKKYMKTTLKVSFLKSGQSCAGECANWNLNLQLYLLCFEEDSATVWVEDDKLSAECTQLIVALFDFICNWDGF